MSDCVKVDLARPMGGVLLLVMVVKHMFSHKDARLNCCFASHYNNSCTLDTFWKNVCIVVLLCACISHHNIG